MKQRVVKMLLVALIAVVCAGLRGVRGDGDVHGEAEPSHHVMHIRKLSDSDKLKIELEPVWFHLGSAEQKPLDTSQQVKRQAKHTEARPVQIFSSLKHLDRHRRKNRYDSDPEPADSGPSESFLKDFWHAEAMSDPARSVESVRQRSSLEQQLDDTDLPNCFRRYLNEMYDRNSDSVRKLMRCLGQHPEESCQDARRAQRLQSAYRGRENRENDPQQALYERKVIRRRKFSDHRDQPPVVVDNEEELKFEKHFIRPDSDDDDAGHVFTSATSDGSGSESASNENGSSDESTDRGNDVRSSAQGSEDPEGSEQEKYDPREPYRRPMPKYNTHKSRRDSDESEPSCSCEGSESCEDC